VSTAPICELDLLARRANTDRTRGTQQPSAHTAACYRPLEPTRGERH
jgi:hypothetical protein